MSILENNANPGLNYKQFYKEFGHLLYAIAYSDGEIRKKEVEVLREFVLKELAPFEPSSDSSGMNKAFYTQFEFEEMANKKEDATVVFLSFITYLQKNSEYLNEHHITSILNAVEKVAQAYKRTNRMEQEMIDKLKLQIAALQY